MNEIQPEQIKWLILGACIGQSLFMLIFYMGFTWATRAQDKRR